MGGGCVAAHARADGHGVEAGLEGERARAREREHNYRGRSGSRAKLGARAARQTSRRRGVSSGGSESSSLEALAAGRWETADNDGASREGERSERGLRWAARLESGRHVRRDWLARRARELAASPRRIAMRIFAALLALSLRADASLLFAGGRCHPLRAARAAADTGAPRPARARPAAVSVPLEGAAGRRHQGGAGGADRGGAELARRRRDARADGGAVAGRAHRLPAEGGVSRQGASRERQEVRPGGADRGGAAGRGGGGAGRRRRGAARRRRRPRGDEPRADGGASEVGARGARGLAVGGRKPELLARLQLAIRAAPSAAEAAAPTPTTRSSPRRRRSTRRRRRRAGWRRRRR